MPGDYVARVSSVGKKFARRLKHAMWYGLRDLAFPPRNPSELRPGEFWALRGVNFELKRSECLGVIGANGSGKSTLLKLLGGILSPDEGRIEIHGRIGALIEIGAGFHPLLSGRENIYVNGAILGMSKREIDANFDAIVDFAGIGEFLDTPVKFYSSGMYVRLGFAVAAHTQPEVLLIDEVLAVGDAAFRARCYARIRELLVSGTAVILVSHNLFDIRKLCDRVVQVMAGMPPTIMPTPEAILSHTQQMLPGEIIRHPADPEHWPGMDEGPVRIVSIQTTDGQGLTKVAYHRGEILYVRILLEVQGEHFDGVVWVELVRTDGVRAFAATYDIKPCMKKGRAVVSFEIGPLTLVSSVFGVNAYVWDSKIDSYLYHQYGPVIRVSHPERDERFGVFEMASRCVVFQGSKQ